MHFILEDVYMRHEMKFRFVLTKILFISTIDINSVLSRRDNTFKMVLIRNIVEINSKYVLSWFPTQ